MLILTLWEREEEVRTCWPGFGAHSCQQEGFGFGSTFLCVGLRTCISPGESLHGYQICIQAILQDKPKIATMNLGKVSLGWWWGHQAARTVGTGQDLHCWAPTRASRRPCKASRISVCSVFCVYV